MPGSAMTEARYLLRFDDLCPTMNWRVWDEIEAQLVRHGVRPILAVVPDNRDPKLVIDPPRQDFWERVRGWQAMGWTIALHGYQHLYVNQNPGLMKLTPQSEFAGLPRAVQEAKLRSGLAIFAEQGVRPDAWVAPSHSFDRTTIDLLGELGVPVISDGLGDLPFSLRGCITCIPQQLWDFRRRSSGIWTVCYHHNGWDAHRLERFCSILAMHAAEMTDVPSIVRAFGDRRRTLADRWSASWRLLWGIRLRTMASRLLRRFIPRKPLPR